MVYGVVIPAPFSILHPPVPGATLVGKGRWRILLEATLAGAARREKLGEQKVLPWRQRSLPNRPFAALLPQRQTRFEEMVLINSILGMVYVWWVQLAESASEEEVAALSKAADHLFPFVAKLEEEEVDDDGDDFDVLVPTMIWAITKWICSLEIPDTEDELWVGRPLFERI